jgi:hypothetical protein
VVGEYSQMSLYPCIALQELSLGRAHTKRHHR